MIFGSKGSIGLDIGSSYFKVVQVKDTKKGYELELLIRLRLRLRL